MPSAPSPVPAAARSRADAGFSLVEIIVALGVFLTFAIAGTTVALDSLGTAGDNRDRVRATSLATAEIERTRAQFRISAGNIVEGVTVTAALLDGNTYTVEREAAWVDGAGALVHPVSGLSYTAATGDSLLVEVRIRWPGLGSRPPVISTTVLS
ncbi:MAG: type IV pilus modification PilV family protein [Sporichthyaceae bacterium]